ncbi:MAG: hypothetical protein V8R75_14135 [Oscillospiraceae bacterium]
MVTELQNQSIDQTADTSDMLNQLVQMQMVQALVNMTDASVMSYAASLVGKSDCGPVRRRWQPAGGCGCGHGDRYL